MFVRVACFMSTLPSRVLNVKRHLQILSRLLERLTSQTRDVSSVRQSNDMSYVEDSTYFASTCSRSCPGLRIAPLQSRRA